MVQLGVGITPDRFLIILLLGSLFLHRFWRFLHDFLPFLLIIIAYDYLRGYADDLNPRTHFIEPVNLTKLMFGGHIPTVDLQHWFYTSGQFHWYDYGAAFLYLLHFAVPLGFAFLLWMKNKKQFKEFMLGLVILSYAAFLTYLIYPTAPPWLAAKMGLIAPIVKIFNLVTAVFPDRVYFPTIYQVFSSNLVAAIPSMHASYPFLVFLFALKYLKKAAPIILVYTLAMWLTIVYLGEHYVIDILVGIIYCLVAFKAARFISGKYGQTLDLF